MFLVAAGYRKPHVQWRVPARILDAYPPAAAIPLPKNPGDRTISDVRLPFLVVALPFRA